LVDTFQAVRKQRSKQYLLTPGTSGQPFQHKIIIFLRYSFPNNFAQPSCSTLKRLERRIQSFPKASFQGITIALKSSRNDDMWFLTAANFLHAPLYIKW